MGLVTDLKRNNIHLDYINFASADSVVPALKQNMEVYEKWFVHSMTLEYIPTVAMTATGTIHMAPDYDPIDMISPSTSAMSEAFGYVGGPVSQRLICKMPNMREIDGNYTKGALYCSPADVDRLVSYGFFDVMVEGVTASSTVGRLVLHYDVTFIKPCPYRVFADDNSAITTITFAGDNSNVCAGGAVATSTMENEAVVNSASTLSSCYSAVIDTIASGLTLLNEYNIEIIPGQRIFMKIIDQFMSDGAILGVPVSSTVLAALNLSRTFDPRTALNWSCSSASRVVALRDVMNV